LQKEQKGLSLVGDPFQLSLCTTVSITSLQVKVRLMLKEQEGRKVSLSNQDWENEKSVLHCVKSIV